MSVVCVYNNEVVLNRCLLPSLKSQDAPHELILIDNTQRRFTSAAAALNDGGSRATGDYIMFVHQDVGSFNSEFLTEVEGMMAALPKLGAAGVAGIGDTGKVFTNITHGTPRLSASKGLLEQPSACRTLDECLIVVPSSVFRGLMFDPETCPDWHLYAVDYCLSLNERGLDVYVLPVRLHHESLGPTRLPAVYYQSLRRVIEKHKGKVRVIPTSVGRWRTNVPLTLQRVARELRATRIAAYVRVKHSLRGRERPTG